MIFNRQRHIILSFFLSLGLLLASAGCQFRGPTTTTIAQPKPLSSSCRVILLPFLNDSDDENMGLIAEKICESELINREAKVINEADVRLFLQKKRLFLSQWLTSADKTFYQDMARDLKVEKIVSGKVFSVGLETVQGASLPTASLQLELRDADTGHLLASSFLTRSGDDYRLMMHFGVVRTQSELVQMMIGEIFDDWIDKGVVNCKKAS